MGRIRVPISKNCKECAPPPPAIPKLAVTGKCENCGAPYTNVCKYCGTNYAAKK